MASVWRLGISKSTLEELEHMSLKMMFLTRMALKRKRIEKPEDGKFSDCPGSFQIKPTCQVIVQTDGSRPDPRAAFNACLMSM